MALWAPLILAGRVYGILVLDPVAQMARRRMFRRLRAAVCCQPGPGWSSSVFLTDDISFPISN